MPRWDLEGYYPGVVGDITRMHAVYYHAHWGLDASFETQVGRELAEFIARFNPARDGFWAARCDSRLAGSVAIDGLPAQGPRLRWFLVSPEFHRQGLGQTLLHAALDFCRSRRFSSVFLWTFSELTDARRLYERAGFRLCEERPTQVWGRNLTEQKYVLDPLCVDASQG